MKEDILVVRGIKCRGFHGVYDTEKKEGNDFEVDVALHLDLSRSAHSDRIEDTLDYTRIHDIVLEVMKGESKNLIEHLAHLIGEKINNEFSNLNGFEISVRKLSPPLSTDTTYTEARLSWPRQ